jgi:hypothetical protein
VASLIIAVLLVLSGVLLVTTVFPRIDVAAIFVYLSIALAGGGLVAGVGLRVIARRSGPPAPTPQYSPAEKASWRMPALALLTPVQWSPGRKAGMLALRGYLVLSVILLIVKAVQLGGV